MNLIWILFFILSLSNTLNSQVIVKNLSLTQPDTNILFYGLDNIITISDTSVDNCNYHTNIHLEVDNKTREFSIIPNEKDSMILKFYKNIKVLYTKKFYIKFNDRTAKVILGDLLSTSLTVNEVIQAKKLNIYFEKSLYKSGSFEIISSDIFIKTKKDTASYLYKGGFSNDYYKKVKTLKSGDFIMFERVKVISPNSIVRQIPGTIIKIK